MYADNSLGITLAEFRHNNMIIMFTLTKYYRPILMFLDYVYSCVFKKKSRMVEFVCKIF